MEEKRKKQSRREIYICPEDKKNGWECDKDVPNKSGLTEQIKLL